MKELISDKVYEKTIKGRLEQSRALMQRMIDEYNSLGGKPCTSSEEMHYLVMNPKEMVSHTTGAKKADVAGLDEQEKKKYVASLKFKNSYNFEKLAEEAAQDPYCQQTEQLFTCNEASEIGYVQDKLKEITKAKSVIVQSDRQEAIGKKLLQLRDIFNEVNSNTHGMLKMGISELFVPDSRPNGEANPVVLDIVKMREILRTV